MTKRIPRETNIQFSIFNSQFLLHRVRSCNRISNAEGRVAYWLIAGLLLLIIFSGALILFRTGGIADKQLRSIIAADQKEASEPPQLYKIAAPVEAPARAGPGAPSDTMASEMPGDESGISQGNNAGSDRLAGLAGTVDRQDELPPLQTGKQPVEEVEKEGSIATREHADPKHEAKDVTTKSGKEPSQEIETASHQAEAGAGKRFFVQVDVGNVREGPSIASGIKFRIKKGCSLTVTGKKEGWYAVKMDDGRCGWVYHTLLADSFVPQKDIQLAVRKIEAIRPEAPVDNAARVVFKLNGPCPPEIMRIEEGRPRIVCDFLGASLAPEIGNRIEVNNGIIEKIRIGLHKWPQFKTRVVLDLVPEQKYKLEKSFVDKENGFVLVVKAE